MNRALSLAHHRFVLESVVEEGYKLQQRTLGPPSAGAMVVIVTDRSVVVLASRIIYRGFWHSIIEKARLHMFVFLARMRFWRRLMGIWLRRGQGLEITLHHQARVQLQVSQIINIYCTLEPSITFIRLTLNTS